MALPTTGNPNVGSGAVFWQGADGNIYLKAPQTDTSGAWSTTNLGAANPQLISSVGNTATQIQNPSDVSANNTTQNTGSGTGSTGGVLSKAIIDAANASIANKITELQNQYNQVAAANAASDRQQDLNSAAQQQSNSESRATAIQNAEQAAAQGNQGLKSVLASLGALNGTGSELAGRAVADTANSNIGTADQTYTTNNAAINQAIDAYKTQKNARDVSLANALTADKQNATVTGKQNLVDEAENVGDTSLANQLLSQLVGATAPTQVMQATPVLYNGANLATYAPSSSLNVTSAPATNSAAAKASTTPVNSALYIKKNT